MNRIVVLTLTGLFLITVNGLAQQSQLLKKKISVDASNVTYDEALTLLSDAGGFSFSFNPDILPEDSLLNMHYAQTPLREIMTDLLGDESDLRLNGNHLVILETRFSRSVPEVVPENETVRIEGYVRDAATGASIPNKTVYDVKGLHSTTTDAQGKFILDIPAKGKFTGIATNDPTYSDTSLVVRTKAQQIILPVRVHPDTVIEPYQNELEKGVRKVNLLKIVQWVTSATGIKRSGYLPLSTYRPAQLSFLPFAGTNLMMSGAVSNTVSINVLAGYNGAVSAFEIGGLMNIDRFNMHGFQAGGLANVVGNDVQGMQIAGLFNTDLGKVKGFQVAGIHNLAVDSVKGMQLAGINNLTRHSMNGFQLAGILNIAIEGVEGSQLGGIINFSGRDLSGFQLGGIINVTPGVVGDFQLAGIANYARQVRQFQLAGIMNFVPDTTKGVQFAGILNYSRINQGLQFGLINVADSVSGVSIGLLNFVRHGYNKLEIHGNEVLPLSVRLKFGGRAFYTIIGAGVNPDKKVPLWGYSYGMGFSFDKKDHVNLDLSVTNIQRTTTAYEGLHLNGRAGLTYSFRLGNKARIFAGPVWSMLGYGADDEHSNYLEDIIPYELSRKEINGVKYVQWIGMEAGIRLF